MAFLLVAVVVPAACLLWFMDRAMRNERLAARQKLAEVYRGQLFDAQAGLQERWRETAAQLEAWAASSPASAAFAHCLRSGKVDSVIIFDSAGRVAYPNAPSVVPGDLAEDEPAWREASHLEFLGQYPEAARQYQALGRVATHANAAARAFQAELRCLRRAGQLEALLQRTHDIFADVRFGQAVDPQGRLIAANVELMALECIPDRGSPVFQALAQRLADRLVDYDHAVLAAPQRRFLMNALQALSPEIIPRSTLAAEYLAANLIETHPYPAENMVLQPSPFPRVWQFTTPDRRVTALFGLDRIMESAQTVLGSVRSLPGARVELAPPDADIPDALVALPVGEPMPGWRLALSLQDQNFFNAGAGRQTAVYLWTGLLVVAVMSLLASIALRLVRRQMALARLKNDLAATVSHELKTPLSSIGVLVETLLDSERLEEGKTREYLQLIAQENDRLSRLIENFLAFSRLQRRNDTLQFWPVPPRRVVETALAAVRLRFARPGCRLEARLDGPLPPILADPDALATALVNLLENAFKYSGEAKYIVLGARAENGSVIFSVEDNGQGIEPGERKRIFQPFYRSDRRLSQPGDGCGLGLSIVRSIAQAHHGRVMVESQPGRGSTFSIAVPAAAGGENPGKEVLA